MRVKASRPLWAAILLAALAGVAASLGLMLLMALGMQKNWVEISALSALTTGIKVISGVLAGVWVRRMPRAWLCGCMAGGGYAMLAWLLISALSGGLALNWGVVGDMGMGALSGAFGALLCRALR